MNTKHLASIIMLSATAQLAHAQSWNGTDVTGFWDDTANWSGGSVPTSGQNATIDNGGTAVVRDAREVGRIFPGWNGGQTGTVRVDAGGSLLVSGGDANIGQSGNGTLHVNGGSITINNNMQIGHAGDATIRITSGTFTSKGNMNMNLGGTATFDVTGGTLATRYIGIDSNQTFGGTLSVGEIGSAGGLQLQSASSNFTMTNTSAMRFDIGGSGQSTAFDAGAGFYDRIIASSLGTGNLELGGTTLEIYMTDDFESTITESFSVDIINRRAAGTFGNVNFGERLDTADGKGSFLVSWNSTNGEVRISDWQAIPEPGSFALLAGLTGLSAIALRRRRS